MLKQIFSFIPSSDSDANLDRVTKLCWWLPTHKSSLFTGTGRCKDNSAKPAAKPKATTTTTKKPKSGGGLLSKIKGALG